MTYCLSKDTCYGCIFHKEFDDIYLDCALFNGRFAELSDGVDTLKSISLAYSNHILNASVNCDELCIFKHNDRCMNDCYFTDITNRIGKSVKNI